MVKRVNNLMPRIASMENLHEAFLRSVRGKESKLAVVRFRQRLDENLLRMRSELLDGTFQFGNYHRFLVYDPKEREICGAPFAMAVALMAMMRICHPVFDDFQTYGSYASRPGRGTYKALEHAQRAAQRYGWFAKLDVCKYFDSISHEVMLAQLSRLFKDPVLLLHFRRIIDSYASSPGRGLPIGNLTSQYFANHYLAVADHWGKEQLRVRDMVRYMDDTLLFADDRAELMRQVRTYTAYVEATLRVRLHEPVVNRTKFGIPFLGYVVYDRRMRLTARSQQRYRQKMLHLARGLRSGRVEEQEYAVRATCLNAFVGHADATGYRHHLGKTCQGIYPQEL